MNTENKIKWKTGRESNHLSYTANETQRVNFFLFFFGLAHKNVLIEKQNTGAHIQYLHLAMLIFVCARIYTKSVNNNLFGKFMPIKQIVVSTRILCVVFFCWIFKFIISFSSFFQFDGVFPILRLTPPQTLVRFRFKVCVYKVKEVKKKTVNFVQKSSFIK